MRVSATTRRKLFLLNKERAADFKIYLNTLTSADREGLSEFVKGIYIQKRNMTILFSLAQTGVLFKYAKLLFCFSASNILAGTMQSAHP